MPPWSSSTRQERQARRHCLLEFADDLVEQSNVKLPLDHARLDRHARRLTPVERPDTALLDIVDRPIADQRRLEAADGGRARRLRGRPGQHGDAELAGRFLGRKLDGAGVHRRIGDVVEPTQAFNDDDATALLVEAPPL